MAQNLVNHMLLVSAIALASLSCADPGYNEEISVSSEVDKCRITRAESITLTIIISGELSGTPGVELPDPKSKSK